ncbi:Rv0361 family membrane protein [Gordonia mangrovi]|uniref:Rv0361 family membrane protein n=1 Tax=Gordonia mangrovi TaxID=2665643 RepID=UPI004039E68A
MIVLGLTLTCGSITACGAPDSQEDIMGEEYATETAIRTTAVQLYEAMSRNDWDRYNSLQCTQQRSDTPMDPGLAKMMSRLEVRGVNITSRTDTSAEVEVRFRYSDESGDADHTEKINVIREEGEWLAC